MLKMQMRRLASSRGLVASVCGPCATPQDLVAQVQKMQLTLPHNVAWTLHHERLSLHNPIAAERLADDLEKTERKETVVKTAEICVSLARCIRGGNVQMGARVDVRFVVLESRSGLYFGVSMWSRADELYLDLRSAHKPFIFNAALDPDVATVALNLLRASSHLLCDGNAEANEVEWGVVNACSGSGTCVVAALDAGASWVHAIDINPSFLEGALG